MYHWDLAVLLDQSPSGESYLMMFCYAFFHTIEISILSIAIAFPMGLIIGALKTIDFIKYFSHAMIEIFCNIPFIVQLFIWYFVLPELIPVLKNINNDYYVFLCGLFGLSLYSSVRIAKHIYAGIHAISINQLFAGKILGLSLYQIYIKILIPIGLRRVLPSLCNECIGIVKNSAIVSTIGFIELTKQMQDFITQTSQSYEAFIIVLIAFLIINLSIIYIFSLLENKFKLRGKLA